MINREYSFIKFMINREYSFIKLLVYGIYDL